jgi:multiple sugar transport system ATP-binding protein
MTLGSRIAVMKGGVLQQLGTPDEIYNRPANTYVASFIGSPTMNLVPGHNINTQGVDGFQIAYTQLPITAPKNGEVLMGVRPEHIALDDAAPWRGEVSVVEPTGADTYVVVKTGVGDVTVRVSAQAKVKAGDSVGLALAADHVNWFDAGTGTRI